MKHVFVTSVHRLYSSVFPFIFDVNCLQGKWQMHKYLLVSPYSSYDKIRWDKIKLYSSHHGEILLLSSSQKQYKVQRRAGNVKQQLQSMQKNAA